MLRNSFLALNMPYCLCARQIYMAFLCILICPRPRIKLNWSLPRPRTDGHYNYAMFIDCNYKYWPHPPVIITLKRIHAVRSEPRFVFVFVHFEFRIPNGKNGFQLEWNFICQFASSCWPHGRRRGHPAGGAHFRFQFVWRVRGWLRKRVEGGWSSKRGSWGP